VNVYQMVMLLFGVAVITLDIWAMFHIAKSDQLRFKPLWMIGSLFGFFGLGINWTKPDDIFLQFGIQIPFLQVVLFPKTHEVAAKLMFPLIAAVALVHGRPGAEKIAPKSSASNNI